MVQKFQHTIGTFKKTRILTKIRVQKFQHTAGTFKKTRILKKSEFELKLQNLFESKVQ